MKKFKQIGINNLEKLKDENGNAIIKIPKKTKALWFMEEENMPGKYLTKKEYNEIPPKWFSEFLELYKADREENNKRWDENNKRWDENNKRWDENNKRWDENDKRWEEQMLFNKNHTHDK